MKKPTLLLCTVSLVVVGTLLVSQLSLTAIADTAAPPPQSGDNPAITADSSPAGYLTTLETLGSGEIMIRQPAGQEQIQSLPGSSSRFIKNMVSRLGGFTGSAVLSEADPNGNRRLNLTVRNTSGSVIYTLQLSVPFDEGLPGLHLAENSGALLVSRSTESTIAVYNSLGQFVRLIHLFNEADYDLERIQHLSPDASGITFAVAAGKRGTSYAGPGPEQTGARPQLFLFSINGELLWQRDLPGNNTLQCRMSPDSRFIAVNSYSVFESTAMERHSQIYTAAGELLFEAPLLFKYVNFSPDNAYVLLAENQHCLAYDLQNNTVLWNRQIPRAEGAVVALRSSAGSGNSLIVLADNQFRNGGFIFTKPRFKVINSQGGLITDIARNDLEFANAALVFATGGRQIRLHHQGKAEIIDIQGN